MEWLVGFLRRREVAPETTWAILAGLRELGADEFSISMVGIEGVAAPHLDALEQELLPFSVGSPARENLTAPRRTEFVRPTPAWTLNDDSVEVLRRVFRDGLFQYPAFEQEGGWVEDFLVFYEERLVFGIVHHESEAVLRLPPDEYQGFLNRVGLTDHPQGEWI